MNHYRTFGLSLTFSISAAQGCTSSSPSPSTAATGGSPSLVNSDASAGGDTHVGGATGTPPSDAATDSGGEQPWTGPLDLSAVDATQLTTPVVQGLNDAQARARSIVTDLTQDDKLTLVQGVSGAYVGNVPAVAGVPALTLQDGPAGVARFTGVTAFPAPITLAASWDRDLVQRWGTAMAAEERGKGVMIQLGPMMNMVRSPLAGRNFESFGEDPYLAAELAARDVQGIQSQKVVATAKHYVGNEQETNRVGSDSEVDERTLHEIYYAPFEASVAVGAGAVMCSFNRLNTIFACENPTSLSDLKTQMGFSGWVMSDWGATQSTVDAANAGLDMEMPVGAYFAQLGSAIANGSVQQQRLDDMVTRIFTSLIRVGVLDDPPGGLPSTNVTSPEHTQLALEAASAGITLLKNDQFALPLGTDVKSIVVVGSAGSTSPYSLGGGSAFVTGDYVASPLTALQNLAGSGVSINFNDGTDLDATRSAAGAADAAIVFASVNSSEGVDRTSLALDFGMDDVIAAVAAVNARTVVVLDVPSAVLMPWLDSVRAVLVAWYPGQENGNAIAPVLLGTVNPSGKLPVTFPASIDDLPRTSSASIVSYDEQLAIGYRLLDANGQQPLFPFGFGLSYTHYQYSDLALAPDTSGSLQVSFSLENTGGRAGTETAEVYLGFPAAAGEPPKVLRGFQRVTLAAAEQTRVTIELPPVAFSYWNTTVHARTIASGRYQVFVGGSSSALTLQSAFDVVGND